MSATGSPAFWPMFEPRVPGFVHIDAPDPYRFVSRRSVGQPRRRGGQSARGGDRARRPGHRRGVHRRAGAGRRRRDHPAGRLLSAHPRDLRSPRRAVHLRRSDHRLRPHRDAGSASSTTASSRTSCSSRRGSRAGTCRSAASACRTRIRDVMNSVPPDKRWMHAYTYSGHPTCCAVALRNLKILEDEHLVERAATLGARFSTQARAPPVDRGRRPRSLAGVDGRASRSSPTRRRSSSIRRRRR